MAGSKTEREKAQRTIAENRKASAQSVNAVTLDGLRVRGTGKAMGRAYVRGVTLSGDGPGQPRCSAARAAAAIAAGSSIGPKCVSVGCDS